MKCQPKKNYVGGGNMNRCIHCVYYKILFIRNKGKYKVYPNDGFCDLKKQVISKDGCCEVWQKRKIDRELYDKKHIFVFENSGIFVLDFDK